MSDEDKPTRHTKNPDPPVQHRSSRPTVGNQYDSKYPEATFAPVLPHTVFVNRFSPQASNC